MSGQSNQPGKQRASADAPRGGIVGAHLQQFCYRMACRSEKRQAGQSDGEGTQPHEDVVVAPRDVGIFVCQNRFQLRPVQRLDGRGAGWTTKQDRPP